MFVTKLTLLVNQYSRNFKLRHLIEYCVKIDYLLILNKELGLK